MKVDRRTFLLSATGLFSFLLTSHQVAGQQAVSDSGKYKAGLMPDDKIIVKNGWIIRSSQLLQRKNIKS
jgi:hypothetical protein